MLQRDVPIVSGEVARVAKLVNATCTDEARCAGGGGEEAARGKGQRTLKNTSHHRQWRHYYDKRTACILQVTHDTAIAPRRHLPGPYIIYL
eukprot:945191-Prorocentrum_minimum.AAC.1